MNQDENPAEDHLRPILRLLDALGEAHRVMVVGTTAQSLYGVHVDKAWRALQTDASPAEVAAAAAQLGYEFERHDATTEVFVGSGCIAVVESSAAFPPADHRRSGDRLVLCEHLDSLIGGLTGDDIVADASLRRTRLTLMLRDLSFSPLDRSEPPELGREPHDPPRTDEQLVRLNAQGRRLGMLAELAIDSLFDPSTVGDGLGWLTQYVTEAEQFLLLLRTSGPDDRHARASDTLMRFLTGPQERLCRAVRQYGQLLEAGPIYVPTSLVYIEEQLAEYFCNVFNPRLGDLTADQFGERAVRERFTFIPARGGVSIYAPCDPAQLRRVAGDFPTGLPQLDAMVAAAEPAKVRPAKSGEIDLA